MRKSHAHSSSGEIMFKNTKSGLEEPFGSAKGVGGASEQEGGGREREREMAMAVASA